jgi:DNA-binding Xre family transcriptional regulator
MRLSMPQCICSVRTDAVHLWRPLVTLGLYASTKRVQPLIIHRRLSMSKSNSIAVSNTRLSTITDNIGSIAGSLSGLCQLLECGETSTDRLSYLIEVLSRALHDDYNNLTEIIDNEVAS